MHFQWLGQTCVKLQTKNLDEDITILIDPYRPSKGDFPRSFSPHIGLFSHGTENAVTLSQDPFALDTLGECETKGVMVYSLTGGEENLMFKINAEGMNVLHLGKMKKPIENGDLEKIGSVDILLIPVGGGDYLSPEDAANLVTALEPRIVIPIASECDTDPKALSVNAFIKELGLKPETTDKKIIIKQKDLPQEDTKLFILEKNY
ncbi:MAG: MBL fold metallo-hydrolase [Candidatus Magasanikbacteria bacterium]